MIYVMSDIHGMYDKYIEMMDLIDLKETDTLYILGDIIDRGVNSMKILQDMMKRSNVFGIFGNHELMMADCFNIITQEITNEFLDSFDEEKLMKLSDWMNNGAFQTIQEFKKPTDVPRNIMQNIMVRAAMTGAAPILSIFLKLNSNPNVNNKIMTPICAQISILPESCTDGV